MSPGPSRRAEQLLAWLAATEKRWLIVLDDLRFPVISPGGSHPPPRPAGHRAARYRGGYDTPSGPSSRSACSPRRRSQLPAHEAADPPRPTRPRPGRRGANGGSWPPAVGVGPGRCLHAEHELPIPTYRTRLVDHRTTWTHCARARRGTRRAPLGTASTVAIVYNLVGRRPLRRSVVLELHQDHVHAVQ
jgi:hypothetical protein